VINRKYTGNAENSRRRKGVNKKIGGGLRVKCVMIMIMED